MSFETDGIEKLYDKIHTFVSVQLAQTFKAYKQYIILSNTFYLNKIAYVVYKLERLLQMLRFFCYKCSNIDKFT